MSFDYSTKFKNAILDTLSLKEVFEGDVAAAGVNCGYIVVYSGPIPANVHSALSLGSGGNVALIAYGIDTTNASGPDMGGGNHSGVAANKGLSLVAAAVGGSIQKAVATWQGRCFNSGNASFWRYERSPSHIDKVGGVALGGAQDNGTADAATDWFRIQGSIGGAGADLIVQSNTYTAGVDYTLQFFSVAVPAL